MKKRQNKIKLSIIILNHNTSDLLKECLSSIPVDNSYQIIVVDNASTDDSVAMVKNNFPKVQLIQSTVNLGFTRGNNLAKNATKGELVLFLNSDTKMFPDTLPAMLTLMDNDGSIGISTCRVNLPNGQLYYGCHRGFPTPWNSFCYFSGLAKLFPRVAFFSGYTASSLPLTKIHEIDACSGTFLLIRKKLLDEINWFDEDYYSYGEDLEMCFQAKTRGYKVVYNPNATLIHYWGATSGLTKGSIHLSPERIKSRQKWGMARYEAMKIFYDKHYRQYYPELFRQLIFSSINLISRVRKYSD